MVLFFAVDIIVFLVTGISEILMYEKWRNCIHDFNGWGLTIIAFSLISMSLFFFQAYNVKKMKQYVSMVERE